MPAHVSCCVCIDPIGLQSPTSPHIIKLTAVKVGDPQQVLRQIFSRSVECATPQHHTSRHLITGSGDHTVAMTEDDIYGVRGTTVTEQAGSEVCAQGLSRVAHKRTPLDMMR